MGLTEVLELLRPFLKRFDFYLLLFSLVTVILLVIFYDQYAYWPPVIVSIASMCILAVVAAIIYSLRKPRVGIWQEYAIAMTVSSVLMLFLRSAAMFYSYPILMLAVLLAFAAKGGPGGDT
jgi:hypothetical protein